MQVVDFRVKFFQVLIALSPKGEGREMGWEEMGEDEGWCSEDKVVSYVLVLSVKDTDVSLFRWCFEGISVHTALSKSLANSLF